MANWAIAPLNSCNSRSCAFMNKRSMMKRKPLWKPIPLTGPRLVSAVKIEKLEHSKALKIWNCQGKARGLLKFTVDRDAAPTKDVSTNKSSRKCSSEVFTYSAARFSPKRCWKSANNWRKGKSNIVQCKKQGNSRLKILSLQELSFDENTASA